MLDAAATPIDMLMLPRRWRRYVAARALLFRRSLFHALRHALCAAFSLLQRRR